MTINNIPVKSPVLEDQSDSFSHNKQKPFISSDDFTNKQISEIFDKSIQINSMNSRLSDLEIIMSFIIKEMESNSSSELKNGRSQVEKEYETIMTNKKSLVRTIPSNYVELMSRPSLLPKRLRLYHCTKNETAIVSILTDGIKLTNDQHNFAAPEMGDGLYCSSIGPAYLSMDFPVAIVFSIIKDFSCIITTSLEGYLREKPVTEQEIRAGYQRLQNSTGALVNESLAAAKTEISLISPRQHIRVEGVILDNQIDFENVKDTDIIPIQTWRPGLKLHPSWKTD